VLLEERPKTLAPDEALSVAQAGRCLLACGQECVRVQALDLQPVQVERFKRPCELTMPPIR